MKRSFLAPTFGVLALGALVLAAGAAPAPGGAAEVARSYLEQNKQALGLTGSDVKDAVVSDLVVDKHTGVAHVYLRQTYRGIGVPTGIATINVARNGTVLSAATRFVPNIAAAAGGQAAKQTAVQSVESAAKHLGLALKRNLQVLERKGGPADETIVSDGGISTDSIPAKLVWQPVEGGVRLAWEVVVDEIGGEHWWTAYVDAESGAVLAQDDLIVHDTASATAAAITGSGAGTASALAAATAADGSSYRVFPLPLESPTDGDRTLVSNPADPAASPFGWHDTNGADGPEFTRTRGNNVHAYTDRDANNVPDPGSDPDGGPSLTFDFGLNLGAAPSTYRDAAVTNLFYWNNVIHDVFHGYGFDEASGNFQVNNYGNGGLGNDDVRAEAQDGSGRNNANFGTPVDGLRPRMQMFEWRSSLPNTLTVLAPSPIAGDYFGPTAGFGGSYVDTGPITGEMVLVNDGVGVGSDGCTAFGGVAGKIALIDRGTCTFVVKVKNAQNAGATTVVVGNNVVGPPFGMGGSDPTITIPSMMVSLDDANLFKANLPFQARITDGTGGAPDRDSDLDSGVIVHEYGHGISNRLTGGPSTVGCLNNVEQMGEGWSDWLALVLTTHPSDGPTTARGIGTYVIFEPEDGVGIRPTQYTTDTSINPSTYDTLKDITISQPHGIGYVWATMLWDVYWNLVAKHGYNPDVYGDWSTGGNNLAIQLVIDGMKFQPCGPGFVDGRNAILAADTALTGGANQCAIWRAFAKRGLGFGASQGSSLSRFDGTQAFDLPATCSAAFGGFDPPIAAAPALNDANAGATVPVKFALADAGALPPETVATLESEPVDCSSLASTGAASPVEGPGSSGFSRVGDRYHANWKTDPAWAGTCRKLTLRIPDASDAAAYFRFT